MKIYTMQGDAGKTGLYGGSRVFKDELRISAYGNLDELNATLGQVLACFQGLSPKLAASLLRIQGELFQLGAELATPAGKSVSCALIEGMHIQALELEIDQMELGLAPLKTFILPGGTEVSARLHFSRTVSRRAEREMVTLHRVEPLRPDALAYINRLSDYFFVCARFCNHLAGVPDVAWPS